MKQIHQTRINACGASFHSMHHAGAISVLQDLRGVVIRCHPAQVPVVLFAMSEHPFKLPVVGDLSVDPQHVKYQDIVTGGVEYMVDTLSIPSIQTQIEEERRYNGR